jgi:hypothetical protein
MQRYLSPDADPVDHRHIPRPVEGITGISGWRYQRLLTRGWPLMRIGMPYPISFLISW